ncbi:probable phosphodiesterase [Natronomonas pharaonis DSM 2160]|uniref:Probable phosphodiesterase n=1 Tax=Natronomonas pharaonis (strain ATCC 35678 / DSM 2160 / CIP 103997 / JCM 8858 / NBRC 14720 / NCIMB 2260 / Gabara) TaxID=348780 RepID=Q3IMG8_NATPD|nr:alkaline phosphatase family protein [Natronomonas pharaonis]CAI50690.1 probable phosphodiesterase [Natronomonas pharaonis DSM 2160]
MGLFDRLRGGDGPRVAFFGIDGVPYSLVADNEETFENLTAIAENGGGGAIDSIVPPESSACWPALTTGVNPGETGVYGFQDREVDSYDTYVPMGQDVQAKRLWTRVNDTGREATVLNVPVTFPPNRDIQRNASGFLSPGLKKAAYPDELRETLEDLDYKIDVNAKLGHKEDKSAFIEDAHRTLDARFEAFKHYIEQDDWHLFFGVFMTTDRVNHFLYKDYVTDGEYKEEFLEFYAKLDQYLGELRSLLSEETTMVVASDHGFMQLDHEVNCNVWLEENGWLSFDDDDHNSLSDIADDTRAYSLIPGRFYLNLKGREPNGTVPQDEYESVRSELKADLEAMEGPDGKPVADRVVTKEDAFRGDHDDIAPDLVVIPNTGFDLKSTFKGGEKVFTTGPRNGMHSFEDACLFVDDKQATIKNADLYDITPTILKLLDIETDRNEFDGASLV